MALPESIPTIIRFPTGIAPLTSTSSSRLRKAPLISCIIVNHNAGKPDCVLEKDAIAELVNVFDKKDTGMTGPMLLNPDGTEQTGGRRRAPTPLNALIRFSPFLKKYPPCVKRWRRWTSIRMLHLPLTSLCKQMPYQAPACCCPAKRLPGPVDSTKAISCIAKIWTCASASANKVTIFCSRGKGVTLCRHMQHRPALVRGMAQAPGHGAFYRKFFKGRYSMFMKPIIFLAVWFRFGVRAAGLHFRHAGMKN